MDEGIAMQMHFFDGLKGPVAVDATAVVGIVPSESPIGEHSAILLSGGHKVVVEGAVKVIHEILGQPPIEE
jgi:hypothetical protein